jgi:transposase, IS5 family
MHVCCGEPICFWPLMAYWLLPNEFFQHAFPYERSDLSHWRKRLGDKLELLLAERMRVAHEAGALRGQDLYTVQPKAITFPTDAKLLRAAIKGLNRQETRRGIRATAADAA